ncbi:MAG: hypothetical protein ACE14M_01900 [Terriglobales bacterium]
MKRAIQLVLVLLLLASVLVAQTTPPPPASAPQPLPATGDWTQEQTISPAQAEELFRSVDEILQFVSKDTGLPIKHPVKRELANREQVRKFVEDRMKDDEDSRRLARSEIVLKKFGLLPRDFDLRNFLVDLLKEQVAGFYDAKKKTVFLLDWIAPDAQKPVLAHELTHALQDQNFDIEKWTKAVKPKNDDDIQAEEALAARQAVLEGQGMVVLIDYLLAPQGASLLQAPTIADAVVAGMAGGSGMSVYNRAPMFLQHVLLFPYRYGLNFERDLLMEGGREKAFAGALESPPRDSRQVMQPATYLAGQFIKPLPMPDFAFLAHGYKKYDMGVVGQFDVSLLLDQYGSPEDSKSLSPHWRGGYYWAARIPQPGIADKKASQDPASIAIVYISRWSRAEAASRFASIYAAALPKRYHSVQKLTPASFSSESGDPGGRAQSALQNGDELTEQLTFLTEEGPVIITPAGNTVVITESVDSATAVKIRDAVVKQLNH